jgi:hypothetical protein
VGPPDDACTAPTVGLHRDEASGASRRSRGPEPPGAPDRAYAAAVHRPALLLLVTLVAACAGPTATHSPPADPSLARTPAPPAATPTTAATTPPIDPHATRAAGATVTLLGATCPAGRGWLRLHGDSRLARGRCGDEQFTFAIDATGTFGPRQGYDLGLADFEDRDQLQSLQGLGSRTWLAFRDAHDSAGSYATRTRVDVRDGKIWKAAYGGELDASEWVVGVGEWPGGAVIAAIRGEGMGARQRIEVVEGTPSMPLPRLPAGSSLQELVTHASGHAFAVNEGVGLLHWLPGKVEPLNGTPPSGFQLAAEDAYEEPSIIVVSPTEAYVPGLRSDEELKRSIEVLRFDGMRWVTSRVFPDHFGFEGMVRSPDGAIWLLLTPRPDPDEPRDEDSPPIGNEIWRRVPGPGDHWEQVAPESLELRSTLLASSIMSAGEHDLLFAAFLQGAGYGIYRISLKVPGPAP